MRPSPNKRKAKSASAPRPKKPAPVNTANAATRPRLARVAKGKKPQYFADPATDKLLWMTLTLMEELSVTRERLDTMERLLDKKRLVKRKDIESFQPSAEAAAERSEQRSIYIDRMMRAMHAELEEITGKGNPQSQEEVIAAVAS